VTGYTSDEFFADPSLWMRTVFPDDRELVCHHFSKVLSGNPVSPLEHRIIRKDGQVRWIRDTSVLQLDSDGNLVSCDGMIKDITERKLAEEALKAREESYRTLAENLSGIVYRIHINEKSRMQFFNNMLVTLTGYTEEDLVLRGTCSIDTLIVSEDRDRRTNEVAAAIRGCRNFSIDYRITHRDGTTRFFIERGRPVTDVDGLLYIDGIIHDFTEQKQTEEALHLANNKLTMLNSITRHDILNQLTVVLGYLKLSKDDVKDPVFLTYIQKEEQAAEAIRWQIEFTRNYQDIGAQAPKWLNLGIAINSAIRQLKPSGVEILVSTDHMEIFADPILEKVFYNLMENSLRHGEHVTNMVFSAREVESGLILSYCDNGVGIVADDKNKLFRKGFGKHTGLGLFLAREILDITGITIRENGTPGKGVRFEMMVPADMWRCTKNS
jgi:PAS domain S-box-containing protein